jgi:DNA-directed RNA polymerase specialized sigma24 family protein
MNEFGRLLEKEIPRLRRYAFALTRNMSRADDLVQDTLVRRLPSNAAGSAVPTFAPGSSP